MKNFKFAVMLYKKGTGVVAYETVAKNHIEAVTFCINKAFEQFPEAKFALHGYAQSDGDTTVTTTRYLGKI